MLIVNCNVVIEIFFCIYFWIYCKINGCLFGSFGDGFVFFLNICGWKSGVQCINGFIYFDWGMSWVVVVLWVGEFKYLLWYLNLKVDVDVII